MRNLIINREKTAVAALGTMKVYIEDRVSGDTVIDNIPCRKLGFLKNGETATFQIGDDPARVYVIADKMTRIFCNDFFQLFYGTEDIYISGKNKFNPYIGNPFWFNNNNNPEALANKKKSKRKVLKYDLTIFFVCFVLGLVSGFLSADSYSEPKVFSDSGITLTLTEDFQRVEADDYTVAYGSSDVAVLVLKEEFSLGDKFEDYTLTEYADSVQKSNSLKAGNIKTSNGLTWFEYDFTNPDTQTEYRYFSYFYKTSDAFWVVQFATESENADVNSEKITEWAQSVSFE